MHRIQKILKIVKKRINKQTLRGHSKQRVERFEMRKYHALRELLEHKDTAFQELISTPSTEAIISKCAGVIETKCKEKYTTNKAMNAGLE